MILADSGNFVALARPRDSLHEVAILWTQVIREPIVVTEYVLVETMNHLSAPADRRRGQDRARQTSQRALQHATIDPGGICGRRAAPGGIGASDAIG